MKATIYNHAAEAQKEITLDKTIFDAPISPELLARVVRVYRSNLRSAAAKTKNRNEVAGTTKKMWAQKGTGRARHGSAKAPEFVGGGSAHGPSGEQNYNLTLPLKIKQKAVSGLLTQFAQTKSLVIVDLSALDGKTKSAHHLLSGLQSAFEVLSKSRKIGLVVGQKEELAARAFANIDSVNILNSASLNAYKLAQNNFLIISHESYLALTK